MFERKPLSHESVAGALQKAERYRLLNEASEAESICRDILEIEPGNQQAQISLTLSLTDQIGENPNAFPHALAAAAHLTGDYERAYYTGIAWERRAKARYHAGGHGTRHTVYEWIAKALKAFSEAEKLRPAGNDDAILRWNTCVRFLEHHPELAPSAEEEAPSILSE